MQSRTKDTRRGHRPAVATTTRQWSGVVESLEARGMSRARIAREAGVHRSTITRLASGERRTPSYPVGEALLILTTRPQND